MLFLLTLHLYGMIDPTGQGSIQWTMSQGNGEENIREDQIPVFHPATNVVAP